MRHAIYIVDDHPIMRRGYASLVNGETDMYVCGEAGNAADALGEVREKEPDLLIADISLEGMNGIEFIKRLRDFLPDLPVLVVSMHDESLYAERALQAGAQGYLMKNEVDAVIITAIRRILSGSFYLSDVMNRKILMQYAGRTPAPNQTPLERLTDRELEVFEHMGHGLTTREVAEAMHISPKTVETYRGRIKNKLAIDNTSELVQRATLWVEGQKPMAGGS